MSKIEDALKRLEFQMMAPSPVDGTVLPDRLNANILLPEILVIRKALAPLAPLREIDKAIEASISKLELLVEYASDWDLQAQIDEDDARKDWTHHNIIGEAEDAINEIKQALQSRPVDVEGLKKVLEPDFGTDRSEYVYADGWNDCLDHLVEKGIIKDE